MNLNDGRTNNKHRRIICQQTLFYTTLRRGLRLTDCICRVHTEFGVQSYAGGMQNVTYISWLWRTETFVFVQHETGRHTVLGIRNNYSLNNIKRSLILREIKALCSYWPLTLPAWLRVVDKPEKRKYCCLFKGNFSINCFDHTLNQTSNHISTYFTWPKSVQMISWSTISPRLYLSFDSLPTCIHPSAFPWQNAQR